MSKLVTVQTILKSGFVIEFPLSEDDVENHIEAVRLAKMTCISNPSDPSRIENYGNYMIDVMEVAAIQVKNGSSPSDQMQFPMER